MSALLTPLLGSIELDALFADRARVQAMLDVEAALARAQARLGMIPEAAAAAIEAEARAETFDLPSLGRDTARAGNPAIPLVRELTRKVAERNEEAARFVHWGATSQDVIDTALVLQWRASLGPITRDLDRLGHVLAAHIEADAATPMIGRTWLQHALPITFGFKVAGWLDAILRHRQRLRAIRPRLLVLQLGGAAGTLASLGSEGLMVAQALARELDLALPDIPWHSARDRPVEFATELGLLTGTLGKIARDIALLMASEVGEVFEPGGPGRGGSSTMPQKRNPVISATVIAAATRAPGLVATLLAAMSQEHERGVGLWQAEWESLPALVCLAHGALSHMVTLIEGLEIDRARMRDNIDITEGLVLAEAVMMALAPHLGRNEAHARLEAACHRAIGEHRHLKEIVAEDTVITGILTSADLERLFDPRDYLGMTKSMIEKVLATYHRSREEDAP